MNSTARFLCSRHPYRRKTKMAAKRLVWSDQLFFYGTQWLIRPWFARKSKNTFEFIKIVLNVALMVGGYCVFGIFKKSHFNPQLGGAKFRVFWLYISHFWVFQSILKNYQSLSSQKTGIMVQFDRLIIKCQYMDIKKKIFC